MNPSATNTFQVHPAANDAAVFLLDETLETKSAGTCDLLVSLEPEGIQLALKERKKNRFLALEAFTAQGKPAEDQWPGLLEQVTSKSKLLRDYEFSKAIVTIFTPLYTLVPSVLFRPGDEKSYLSFNFQSSPETLRFSQPVRPFQLHTVYGISGSLFRELQHLFEDFSLFHHSRGLLEMISLQLRAGLGRQLFLNVRRTGIDIALTEGKKLLLMNSFLCLAVEDFLYYTLFILEQLEINPEIIPVQVSGDVGTDSAVYKLLQSCFRKIRFADRPGIAECSYVFKELPAHMHYPLFSLPLCES